MVECEGERDPLAKRVRIFFHREILTPLCSAVSALPPPFPHVVVGFMHVTQQGLKVMLLVLPSKNDEGKNKSHRRVRPYARSQAEKRCCSRVK